MYGFIFSTKLGKPGFAFLNRQTVCIYLKFLCKTRIFFIYYIYSIYFFILLLDLERRIREHLDMPNSFNTVAKRAQLAQHLHDLAREQQSICENLVHDQHIQQQGWSAVVANLEDITLEFRKRSEIFEKSFIDYMEERDSYLKFLSQ